MPHSKHDLLVGTNNINAAFYMFFWLDSYVGVRLVGKYSYL